MSKRKVQWSNLATLNEAFNCSLTLASFISNLGLKTLKQSGILDAYQGLLESLCKYGLPTQDLYEFSALTILKHEKKLKNQKKKELQERLSKRNAEKQLNPVRARAVSTNPQSIDEQR